MVNPPDDLRIDVTALQEDAEEDRQKVAPIIQAFQLAANLRATLGQQFPFLTPRYTVAELPVSPEDGQIAFATDEVGGKTIVYGADGSWLRPQDRAVAST